MEGSIDPGSGPLILDIGDGFGALVIYTRPELLGAEIEVRLESLESPRTTHTVVRERVAGERSVFAGVFPELPAGRYRILTDDPILPVGVSIVSGEVAEVDWR